MLRTWPLAAVVVLACGACAPALTVRRAVTGRFSLLLPSRVATPIHGDAVAGAVMARAVEDAFVSAGPPFLDWVAVCMDLRPCGPVDVSVRLGVVAAPLAFEPPTESGQTFGTQALKVHVEVLHTNSGRITTFHDYQDQERGDLAVTPAPALLERVARRVAHRLVRDLQPDTVYERLPLATTDALRAGNTLAVGGHLDDAKAAYEAVLAGGEDAAALHNLGVVLEVQGDAAKAKQAFQRAVALAPAEALYQQALDSLRLRTEDQERGGAAAAPTKPTP